jgi:hypothetical protein
VFIHHRRHQRPAALNGGLAFDSSADVSSLVTSTRPPSAAIIARRTSPDFCPPPPISGFLFFDFDFYSLELSADDSGSSRSFVFVFFVFSLFFVVINHVTTDFVVSANSDDDSPNSDDDGAVADAGRRDPVPHPTALGPRALVPPDHPFALASRRRRHRRRPHTHPTTPAARGRQRDPLLVMHTDAERKKRKRDFLATTFRALCTLCCVSDDKAGLKGHARRGFVASLGHKRKFQVAATFGWSTSFVAKPAPGELWYYLSSANGRRAWR